MADTEGTNSSPTQTDGGFEEELSIALSNEVFEENEVSENSSNDNNNWVYFNPYYFDHEECKKAMEEIHGNVLQLDELHGMESEEQYEIYKRFNQERLNNTPVEEILEKAKNEARRTPMDELNYCGQILIATAVPIKIANRRIIQAAKQIPTDNRKGVFQISPNGLEKSGKYQMDEAFRFFQKYYQTEESSLDDIIFVRKITMLDLDGFPIKNTHLVASDKEHRRPGEHVIQEHDLVTYDEYSTEHIVDAFTLNPEDFWAKYVPEDIDKSKEYFITTEKTPFNGRHMGFIESRIILTFHRARRTEHPSQEDEKQNFMNMKENNKSFGSYEDARVLEQSNQEIIDEFKFKTEFAGDMEVSGVVTIETMLPAHIVLYRLMYSEEHDFIGAKSCLSMEYFYEVPIRTTNIVAKVEIDETIKNQIKKINTTLQPPDEYHKRTIEAYSNKGERMRLIDGDCHLVTDKFMAQFSTEHIMDAIVLSPDAFWRRYRHSEGIDYKYEIIDREHIYLTTTDVMGKTMKYFILFKKSLPTHKDKIFLELVGGLQLKLYEVAYNEHMLRTSKPETSPDIERNMIQICGLQNTEVFKADKDFARNCEGIYKRKPDQTHDIYEEYHKLIEILEKEKEEKEAERARRQEGTALGLDGGIRGFENLECKFQKRQVGNEYLPETEKDEKSKEEKEKDRQEREDILKRQKLLDEQIKEVELRKKELEDRQCSELMHKLIAAITTTNEHLYNDRVENRYRRFGKQASTDDTGSDSLKSSESSSGRDDTSIISDRLYSYTDDVYKSNVEVHCDYAIAHEVRRDPREIKNQLDNFTFVVCEKSEFWKDINFYCEIFNIARERIENKFPMKLLTRANVKAEMTCLEIAYKIEKKGRYTGINEESFLWEDIVNFKERKYPSIYGRWRDKPLRIKDKKGQVSYLFKINWILKYEEPVNINLIQQDQPETVLLTQFRILAEEYPSLILKQNLEELKKRLLKAFKQYMTLFPNRYIKTKGVYQAGKQNHWGERNYIHGSKGEKPYVIENIDDFMLDPSKTIPENVKFLLQNPHSPDYTIRSEETEKEEGQYEVLEIHIPDDDYEFTETTEPLLMTASTSSKPNTPGKRNTQRKKHKQGQKQTIENKQNTMTKHTPKETIASISQQTISSSLKQMEKVGQTRDKISPKRNWRETEEDERRADNKNPRLTKENKEGDTSITMYQEVNGQWMKKPRQIPFQRRPGTPIPKKDSTNPEQDRDRRPVPVPYTPVPRPKPEKPKKTQASTEDTKNEDDVSSSGSHSPGGGQNFRRNVSNRLEKNDRWGSEPMPAKPTRRQPPRQSWRDRSPGETFVRRNNRKNQARNRSNWDINQTRNY